MKRGTPEHPKTVMLSLALERIYARHHKRAQFGGKAQAVGILECLWEWTSKYAIQGNPGKWPNEAIAQGIGWELSANELISALIESRWLDIAPEPHRLVIHDLRDHATNCWRQNLEDAGLTWWDGSPPRKYKLQKNSRKPPENRDKSPQPEPEPEPEPEPQPKPCPQQPAVIAIRRPTANGFSRWIEPWPRCAKPDEACRAWVSVVTAENEEAVFACRDRYLGSDEVSRNCVMEPARFLFEQARGNWCGKWPQANGIKPKTSESKSDEMMKKFTARMVKDGVVHT